MIKVDSKNPSYRLHKPSGQAVVTLNGADVYLGKYNTETSKAFYNRRISEWIAAARQVPAPAADLTIAELMAQYKVHCEAYYRRADGSIDPCYQNESLWMVYDRSHEAPRINHGDP
jgi:hypothetical protein